MSVKSYSCRIARRAVKQGARHPVRKQAGVDKYATANSPLSLAFTNIRGFRSNFSHVETFLSHTSPDIFALCETNLNPSINSSDFGVPGYLHFNRKDSSIHMHMVLVSMLVVN